MRSMIRNGRKIRKPIWNAVASSVTVKAGTITMKSRSVSAAALSAGSAFWAVLRKNARSRGCACFTSELAQRLLRRVGRGQHAARAGGHVGHRRGLLGHLLPHRVHHVHRQHEREAVEHHVGRHLLQPERVAQQAQHHDDLGEGRDHHGRIRRERQQHDGDEGRRRGELGEVHEGGESGERDVGFDGRGLEGGQHVLHLHAEAGTHGDELPRGERLQVVQRRGLQHDGARPAEGGCVEQLRGRPPARQPNRSCGRAITGCANRAAARSLAGWSPSSPVAVTPRRPRVSCSRARKAPPWPLTGCRQPCHVAENEAGSSSTAPGSRFRRSSADSGSVSSTSSHTTGRHVQPASVSGGGTRRAASAVSGRCTSTPVSRSTARRAG